MGYDFHITRAAMWFESETNPITLEEWLAYVASDPEMRLDGHASGAVQGSDEVLQTDDPSMAVWAAYSRDGVDQNHAWMWHCEGRIMAKNADREIAAKMWRIAQHFGGKVVGDEDEMYGADGEPVDEGGEKRASGGKKPWWKKLLGG